MDIFYSPTVGIIYYRTWYLVHTSNHRSWRSSSTVGHVGSVLLCSCSFLWACARLPSSTLKPLLLVRLAYILTMYIINRYMLLYRATSKLYIFRFPVSVLAGACSPRVTSGWVVAVSFTMCGKPINSINYITPTTINTRALLLSRAVGAYYI